MRPIGYLSAPELATLLSQPDAAAAVRVVDVRDSDYEGGHIRGCTHVPAHQFLANVGAYAARWRNDQRVVFHCMLSQVRGPKCATRLAATLADGPPGGPDVFVLDGGWSAFVSGPARRGLCEGVDPRMWGGGAA